MGGAEMGVGGQIKKQKIYKLSESEIERAKMRVAMQTYLASKRIHELTRGS